MASMKDIRKRVEPYVYQNAIFHDGKVNVGSVIGSVLHNEPDLRNNPHEVKDSVLYFQPGVEKKNRNMQELRLSIIRPEMLEKEERKQEELPPLPNAKEGKVVTRFAPSPTGPLNIAQLLRAGMMNFLYARKYRGRFILRLEDTDAGKIRKEFYQDIQDDLEAAGIKWDKLVIASDNMATYYMHARTLLAKANAYMCTCPADVFRELKIRKQKCPCRDNPPKMNLSLFSGALEGGFREGGIVMRFKTSMSDPNPAIRDPPIMRVNRTRHPLKGSRYVMWPLYNYANTIDDHKGGVTHVFRGKEHQHNTDIQKRIYEALGWTPPTTVNFGMIYLPGEKVHTRDIREWIKSGKVTGWNDPRLHTVRALIRRGFQPGAFRLYAIQVGLTKSDIRMSWDNLESFNRSMIDLQANRYMVVTDPVKVSLMRGPDRTKIMVDLHPDDPRRGKKAVLIDRKCIYISRDDWKRYQGRTVRLKNLLNVKLSGRTATYSGDEVVQSMPKIHWVSNPVVEVKLLMPDRKVHALGEKALRDIKKGEIFQMERLGYARMDHKGKEITAVWTHR